MGSGGVSLGSSRLRLKFLLLGVGSCSSSSFISTGVSLEEPGVLLDDSNAGVLPVDLLAGVSFVDVSRLSRRVAGVA